VTTYALIEKLLILRGTVVRQGMDLSLAIIAGELDVFDFKLRSFLTYDVDQKVIKKINLFKPYQEQALRKMREQGPNTKTEITRAEKSIKKKYEEEYIRRYETFYENAVSVEGEIPTKNKRETLLT